MQPVDALTIKAVLAEARPLLLNRKVDKVHQVARDELVIGLRGRTGMSNLLLSAHASFGRVCLVNKPPASPGNNPPNFCLLLRKHLAGATLVGVEQATGERIVDLIFSCLDELGSPAHKVLTAEIMGRHSNLIFWDKASALVLGASHFVTKEMSRHREVMPGLTYVRPPAQDKPNLFLVDREQFSALNSRRDQSEEGALEQWLVATFAGIGKHLAEELAATVTAYVGNCLPAEELKVKQGDILWAKINELSGAWKVNAFMRHDLSRYTVAGWWPRLAESNEWKSYPSANDLVEEYFRRRELKERVNQLKDRLYSELKQDSEKLHSRLQAASRYTSADTEKSECKKFGDLILAHVHEIKPGDVQLNCADLYSEAGAQLSIPLNPSVSPSQNAQSYYRQFAKLRSRAQAAAAAAAEASNRLSFINKAMAKLQAANTLDELERLKETISPPRAARQQKPSAETQRKKPKQRLLSVTSSDGFVIYVGRNRQENDYLVSHLASPHDIWMHIQGQGGAHVLIKVPSTRQEPPARTLYEASQTAARMSKAGVGGKVHVVYTQCRYVRKIAKNKPGVVRYENEKTLEVDTGKPMPETLRKLFSH